MESTGPTPEASTAAPAKKSQRVLACILCQQRKIKCDRKFPCANCTKANAQCVPANLVPRQRRRRFPERELLDRLRRYEDLMRKNAIDFEPMHKSNNGDPSGHTASGDEDSQDDSPVDTPGSGSGSKREYQGRATRVAVAKSYWNAMNHKPQDRGNGEPADVDPDSCPDDVEERVITRILDEKFNGEEHVFFGTRSAAVDLSTLHPEQSRLFMLWQTYLENVDPLLKVTHTPTLQARIVTAMNDIKDIEPALEALMFSIYCAASHTLDDNVCHAQFGVSAKELQANFQFGCRQALLNCSVARSRDREVLTALLLYLVASKPSFDPRALFSMLGGAMRIAKRMGIHIEAINAKCDALEAELRRRLWWALVMYDDRVSEMSAHKDAALGPTWDCKIPSNVNDVDLRAEMKSPPLPRLETTEAIAPIVRAEIGDFVRRSIFHLDFTNPILKCFIMDVRHGPIRRAGELVDLEKMIEERYLKALNPDIPLHFITIWSTRCFMAKKFIMDHYSRYSNLPQEQTEEQKDTALGFAMRMLNADTVLANSPLTKCFGWYLNLYFPFPAYIHIIHDLRRRPGTKLADQAWKSVNDNYDARFLAAEGDHSMFYRIFPRAIMAAWRARESFLRQSGLSVQPPPLVTSVRIVTAQMGLTTLQTESETSGDTPNSISDITTPTSFFDTGSDTPFQNLGGFGMLPPSFWDLSQPMDADSSQASWPGMNWTAAPNFNWST